MSSHREFSCPSRREFLRAASLGCLGALFAGLGAGLAGCDTVGERTSDSESGITIEGNTIRLDLTKPDARPLAVAGGFLFIRQARTIALNLDGSRIRAFTSVCPHAGCDVSQFQGGQLICPCHGSRFNTSGQVLQGPAAQPLREYGVSRSGDLVTIRLS
ncbi:MAG: Rieske (2Fe-2S) protein [Bacteroidetes bacterium]|nr:Rieske (2Fe-2S) protein [Rhodothermia bacterium]MCX7907788.1 Rieske (2Fe-2S) protein [Bacteroidota bacterium]MDW8284807.1 Rieske (2Fe-2S) protein [Bacteroidota bacterium]